VKSFEAVGTPVEISYRGERHFTRPWGVAGGHDGAGAAARVLRSNGSAQDLKSKQIVMLQPGERLEIETAGGAGYGDPLLRDPGRVRADVRDRKISAEAACAEYGFEGV
jgi:N-methylhydantoinase B